MPPRRDRDPRRGADGGLPALRARRRHHGPGRGRGLGGLGVTSAAARPRAEESPETRGVLPPHAPEQGRVRRLLGRFYVTGVFWYRLPYNAVRYHVLSRYTFPAWVALCSTIFSQIGRASCRERV